MTAHRDHCFEVISTLASEKRICRKKIEMDERSAVTTSRSLLGWIFLSLCLVLTTLAVALSLSNSPSHLRLLKSSSSTSGGSIAVPILFGVACNSIRRWLTDGWPDGFWSKMFWVWMYLWLNGATAGLGGMIWLGMYCNDRYHCCCHSNQATVVQVTPVVVSCNGEPAVAGVLFQPVGRVEV